MHKTRCKCIRKKEKKEWSVHGDNTNVLAKEFKLFAIKRFGKQTSLLIISVNELKSKSAIFDKLPNEMMSNLYVFSLKMLNQILRDVDGTVIVIVLHPFNFRSYDLYWHTSIYRENKYNVCQ